MNDEIKITEEKDIDFTKEEEITGKTAKELKILFNGKKNLEFWKSVEITDPRFTKKQEFGARLTSIDAQYQLKNATEKWGKYGTTWGIKNENFDINKDIINNNMTSYCFYSGILFYPDGEFSIHADIEIIFSSGNQKGKYNNDWSKKIVTDALTKGLSKLGFNADVYMGTFGDNKYFEQNNKQSDNTNCKQSVNKDKTKPLNQIKEHSKKQKCDEYHNSVRLIKKYKDLLSEDEINTLRKEILKEKEEKEWYRFSSYLINLFSKKIIDELKRLRKIGDINEKKHSALYVYMHNNIDLNLDSDIKEKNLDKTLDEINKIKEVKEKIDKFRQEDIY